MDQEGEQRTAFLDVFVALGSNLGNSRQLLEDALLELAKWSCGPLLVSSVWETSPVNCPPGSHNFLNAVVRMRLPVGSDASQFLLALQRLEKQMGRLPKTVMNEPRPLDLDLIAFGDLHLESPQLTVPHPRAHQRRFVLQPLAEIAPDLILPGQSEPVSRLVLKLPADPSMKRLI